MLGAGGRYESVVTLVTRVRGRSSGLTERMAVARVNRHAAAKIWQREGRLPIPSISSAKQSEQRLILINWQKLAIAQGPPFWREVKTNDLDFGQKWLGHGSSYRI